MKSNQRTLAIIGASVLMLGFFLPVITFLGFINLSYFDLVRASARFSTGLLILALGAISLFLALKNNFKPLIGTGVLALMVLAFDFITYKRAMAGFGPTGRIGASAGGSSSVDLQIDNELAGIILQPAWGIFIMAAAAIVLIVAGAMKNTASTNGPDWNRNPPPPMNYS